MKSIHVASVLAFLGAAACSASSDVATGQQPAPTPGTTATPPGGSAPSTAVPGSGVGAPNPAPGQAMLRVVHGSADAPAVDVYVKGSAQAAVTGLAYGQTSSWIPLPSGNAEVELRASPSTATSPLVYTTGSIAIPDRANITAVAAGLLASADGANSFRVIPVVNAFDDTPEGKARIRVLHAGADAPSVDLDVGNDNPGAPEVKSLARFSDTGKSGVELDAGKALAIGIDAAGSRVTAFTTPGLPSGADILVVATGLLGKLPRESSGFALLVVGPNGNLGFIKQDPILYALHASPDAPAVDAFAGEAKVIDGLEFGQLTAPIQVQPGTIQLDVFAHGDGTIRPGGSPVLSAPTPMLEAGERYLAIATGFLHPPAGASPLKLQALRDDFALDDAAPRLRAVHASPDAPAVDVGVIDNHALSPVLFGGLVFGNASDGGGLATGEDTIPLGVSPAGNESTIVARFSVTPTTGQRAFAIAAGALSPPAGAQAFRFAVVDTSQAPWTVAHLFPQ